MLSSGCDHLPASRTLTLSLHVHYAMCRTSTDRYANVDVGVLLYHIERFSGILVLTTNLIDNIDKAFFRRLKFVLAFDVPAYKLRKEIWKVYLLPFT